MPKENDTPTNITPEPQTQPQPDNPSWQPSQPTTQPAITRLNEPEPVHAQAWDSSPAQADMPAAARPEPLSQQADGFDNDSTVGTPGSTFLTPPSKSKKKLVLIVAGAATSALLFAGGASAYNFWYQNPDKVVTDAVANAFTADSAATDTTMSFTSKTGDEKSQFNVKLNTIGDLKHSKIDATISAKTNDSSFNMSGSVITKNNEKFYIKIDKLKEVLEKSGLMSLYGTSKAATNLINKIDGNWLVITQKDIDELSGAGDKTSECVEDVLNRLNTDKAYSSEIENLYRKHPFIGVETKLGSKNGSLGYVLELRKDKTIEFVNGINSTKFFKDLKKCDSDIKNLDGNEMFEDYKSDDDIKFTVWVDRWSHNFTKLELTGDSDETDMKITTVPKFNIPVKIDEPKNAITIDELQKDIDAIESEMTQQDTGYISARATTSMNQSYANSVIKKAEVYNAIIGTYPTLNQLINAKDDAELYEEVKPLVSSQKPSATQKSLIQYQACVQGNTIGGALVSYFDETTQSVKTLTAGLCSSTRI